MSCAFAVVGFANSLPSLGKDPSYVTRSWSYSFTFLLGDFWDTWAGSAALDEHLSNERDETRYSFANEPSKRVSFTAHLRQNALCSHAQTHLSLEEKFGSCIALIPESSCIRGMFPVRMYTLRITPRSHLLLISVLLTTFARTGKSFLRLLSIFSSSEFSWSVFCDVNALPIAFLVRILFVYVFVCLFLLFQECFCCPTSFKHQVYSNHPITETFNWSWRQVLRTLR